MHVDQGTLQVTVSDGLFVIAECLSLRHMIVWAWQVLSPRLCVYVCMYVLCMYVCMYVYVYVCVYVCMYVCMYVYVSEGLQVNCRSLLIMRLVYIPYCCVYPSTKMTTN